jgi:enterochelin esterase-like enzyme
VGPTSVAVVVLLIAACVLCVFFAVRFRRWFTRAGVTALAALLGLVLGLIAVNDNYGYYRTWSSVADAIFGGPAAPAYAPNAKRARTVAKENGTLSRITLTGALSHIARTGLVYLPPQYYEKDYANVRFPVVELLHGSPGSPYDWQVTLDITKVANELIDRGVMGPMVLVMPEINAGRRYLECVNGPYAADETYVADDVRADVQAQFRVSTDPAEWGIAGYSSGGYCAANIALRERTSFGAAGIIDGYFRAGDGPAASDLGNDPALVAANSPIAVADHLPADVRPLPAFWVAGGTEDGSDFAAARAFVAALGGLEQVTFAPQKGAGHDFYSWSTAVPTMLAWMWQQLAPPDLRTLFPVAGKPTLVQVPPVPHRRKTPATPTTGPAPPTVTATVTVTASTAVRPATSTAGSPTRAAPRSSAPRATPAPTTAVA